MSPSETNMAARSKRSAEERRLAILREIANEGANRNCLECHQRGPTYVDMTIGSFICTKCCGLLRGLNPPHRTKSITMTNFADEEIEFIKNRGNEFNRYVYLGTYDERSNLEKESLREGHKVKEFLVQKYERKRWYVDPEIAQHKMQLDRRQKAAAEHGVSLTGGSVSMPSKPPASFATRSQPVTPAGGELWSPPPTNQPLNDLFALCKETIPPPVDPFKTSSVSSSSALASDPFQSTPTSAGAAAVAAISPPPIQLIAPASSKTGPANDFADFSSAFGDALESHAASVTTTLKAAASVTSSNELPPPTVTPLQPTQAGQMTEDSTTTSTGVVKPPSADRYAALAELDELFSGQKSDTMPKLQENVVSSSATDPWGNQQPTAAPPPSNPFSPTGTPSSTNNPWGSPLAAASPNPFAAGVMGGGGGVTATPTAVSSVQQQPWGAAAPPGPVSQQQQQHRVTPTAGLAGVTGGLAGMQLNGRLTPTNGAWPPTTNGSTPTLGGFTMKPQQLQQQHQATPPTGANAHFPVAWGAPLQTTPSTGAVLPPLSSTTITPVAMNGSAKTQGIAADWTTQLSQQPWPSGTPASNATQPIQANGSLWGTPSAGAAGVGSAASNGIMSGANFTDLWSQMPSSASNPAIARSGSPAAVQPSSKQLPQSMSMHSQFPSQWPNGSSPAAMPAIANGAPAFANPFSGNGTNSLSTGRMCSASNPFL